MSYTTAVRCRRFLQAIDYRDLGFDLASELDEFLEDIIPMASRFIDHHCNRPDNFFQDGGVTVTEYFDGLGSAPPADYLQYEREIEIWENRARMFNLSERPVLSITSVQELVDGTWVDRTEGDSSAYDYRRVRSQIYFWKSIPRRGWKNLKVIYTAGYATIPSDVDWVCARLIANELHALQEDRGTAKVALTGAPILDFEDPMIFTKDLAERLSPYTKIPMGVL